MTHNVTFISSANLTDDSPSVLPNHHIDETALLAANGGTLATAGEPTLAEIQAYATANPNAWGATGFYTGDDIDDEANAIGSRYRIEVGTGQVLRLNPDMTPTEYVNLCDSGTLNNATGSARAAIYIGSFTASETDPTVTLESGAIVGSAGVGFALLPTAPADPVGTEYSNGGLGTELASAVFVTSGTDRLYIGESPKEITATGLTVGTEYYVILFAGGTTSVVDLCVKFPTIAESEDDAIEVELSGSAFTLPEATGADVHHFSVSAIPATVNTTNGEAVTGDSFGNAKVNDQYTALPQLVTAYEETGTPITATQPDGAPGTVSLVLISGQLELTRGNSGPHYNAPLESAHSSGVAQDVVWFGDGGAPIVPVTGQELTEASMQSVTQNDLAGIAASGPWYLMHTPTSRIWKMDYASWQSGNGGGFSVTATELTLVAAQGWNIKKAGISLAVADNQGASLVNGELLVPSYVSQHRHNLSTFNDVNLGDPLVVGMFDGQKLVPMIDNGGTYQSYTSISLQPPEAVGDVAYFDFTVLKNAGGGEKVVLRHNSNFTAIFQEFQFNVLDGTYTVSSSAGVPDPTVHLAQVGTDRIRYVVQFDGMDGSLSSNFRWRPAGNDALADTGVVFFFEEDFRYLRDLPSDLTANVVDWIREDCYNDVVEELDTLAENENDVNANAIPSGPHQVWRARNDGWLDKLTLVLGGGAATDVTVQARNANTGQVLTATTTTIAATLDNVVFDFSAMQVSEDDLIEFTMVSLGADPVNQMQTHSNDSWLKPIGGWKASFDGTNQGQWRAKLTSVGPNADHTVRVYEDGSLKEVVGNALVALASVDTAWTPCLDRVAYETDGCLFPATAEPHLAASGTLADGTAFTAFNDTGQPVIYSALGEGDVRFESSGPYYLSFDKPVTVVVTSITDPALLNPDIWTYQSGGGIFPDRILTAGKPPVYVPGAVDSNLVVQEQNVDNVRWQELTTIPTSVSAGSTDDWGTVTLEETTQIVIRLRSNTAVNIKVIPLESKDSCEAISENAAAIAELQKGDRDIDWAISTKEHVSRAVGQVPNATPYADTWTPDAAGNYIAVLDITAADTPETGSGYLRIGTTAGAFDVFDGAAATVTRVTNTVKCQTYMIPIALEHVGQQLHIELGAGGGSTIDDPRLVIRTVAKYDNPFEINKFIHDMGEYRWAFAYENGGTTVTDVMVNGVLATFENLNNATVNGPGSVTITSGAANGNYDKYASTVESVCNVGDTISFTVGAVGQFSTLATAPQRSFSVPNDDPSEIRFTGQNMVVFRDGVLVATIIGKSGVWLFERTLSGWNIYKNGNLVFADKAKCINYYDAPQPFVDSASGINRVGARHVDLTPIANDNSTNIVTGHDLLQAGSLGTGLMLKIQYVDENGGHAWGAQEVDVADLISRAAANSANDDSETLFDNDFVIVDLVDAATGTINIRDVGRDVSYWWSELYITAPPVTSINANNVTNWPGTAGQALQSNGDSTFTFV